LSSRKGGASEEGSSLTFSMLNFAIASCAVDAISCGPWNITLILSLECEPIPVSIASCCMSSLCSICQRRCFRWHDITSDRNVSLTMSADLIWAGKEVLACLSLRSTRGMRMDEPRLYFFTYPLTYPSDCSPSH
jgi:hypothetical protein